MSGYLRFCAAGLVLLGGLSATPAFADPFADFFNTAPREPAATASPQAECLPQPGNSSGEGLHWVYRRNGHRKCWFRAEDRATVQKPVHRRVINRVGSADENETVRRKGSSAVDARAELQRSAQAEPSEALHPEVKVADGASDLGTSTARMSAASIAQHSRPPTPTIASQDRVDVEHLLATTPANDVVTSSEPPTLLIGSIALSAEARDHAPSRTATWLGVLLMMLGILSILSSSRSLRHAVRLRS